MTTTPVRGLLPLVALLVIWQLTGDPASPYFPPPSTWVGGVAPLVDGDKVMCRWTWGGTNTGELMGLPPTNRQATTTGMHLCRLEGGRIAETWVSYNALGFLQQLGVVELRAAEAVA